MIDLDGKVAIVTGASRGIGKEIADTLEMAGAVVSRVSRTSRTVTSPFGCDVTNEVAVSDEVCGVYNTYSAIDILVNCAGIYVMKPLYTGYSDLMPNFKIELTGEEWDNQFNTNIKGTYLMSKYAAKKMALNGRGKIINISSIVAIKGTPFNSVYSATKGAIISMTKTLAVELGRFNINVNCICPGFIVTDMTVETHKNKKMADSMINASPLRKLTTKQGVAYLTAFLASNLSDDITGQNLCVDCGVTA